MVSFLLVMCLSATAQRNRETKPEVFTKADTLRGMLTPLRSCYDVRFYHLDVTIDPEKKTVKGSNTIRFDVVTSFSEMQIDLSKEMSIQSIVLDGTEKLTWEREFGAVFVQLPRKLEAGSRHDIIVSYSGSPIVAARPPWDGGFTWTHDSSGHPWVVVTCQGTGASLWWPTKDHQSDKPDSMLISITVPPDLMDVSNGRLRGVSTLPGGWKRFDWFVSYPINTYNVTVNIGVYSHFSDVYEDSDTLTLDYYVLPPNIEKAREQFSQVKGMLRAYERYFGKYPFLRDGYKLVESPHTGMEHQSAVAYGNWYMQGYRGRASSEVGLLFDFIIIHESAHEWWGNSVTAADVADMWIHESFGAYAEALYVEALYGRAASLEYINAKKKNVGNTAPIIGRFNVNHSGSGDMYDKGQLVLNTLRSVIDNDSLWFSIIRGLAERYRYKAIAGSDLVTFVNQKAGTDLGYFFEQYLQHPALPQLDVFLTRKGSITTARYRWKADVADFQMPLKVTTSRGRFEFIRPTTTWQTMTIGDLRPEEFAVATELFYVDVRLNWMYLDPRLKEAR